MVIFCNLKNAYDFQIPENKTPVLSLFIKDKNQKVISFYRYKNGKVEFVNL